MIGTYHRGPAGFSLLEILVAASMLAIAVTALSQLASLGRKHLAAATEQAIATRLATNQMARIAAGIDPPTACVLAGNQPVQSEIFTEVIANPGKLPSNWV